jgi:Rieske Fe-S protein
MSEHRPDSPTVSDAEATHVECAGCGIAPDRREFLRTSAAAVASALLALGARRADALAPHAFTSAVASRGQVRSYSIPQRDGAEIDRDNEVILVRWQGAVYAFALACPHQNTSLRWDAAESRFQCPKHKSRYRPDGTFIEGRATRGMDRYAIRRDGAGVAVDLETVYQEDTDGPQWAAAVVRL